MAKLAEMDQKQIKLADILGGLGYILGLVGLAAYMHYRRQTRDQSI
jgi:flagellar biogenesis protein FliO